MTGNTDTNGYYTLAIKPINIGGPFALSLSVTSIFGNYNTIQGNVTVTAPLVVPVASVLQGVIIAGQTGTMPAHISGAHTLSLAWWTGGGTDIYLCPPAGYYDGGTYTHWNEPNLVPGNIKNGVSVLGVVGTYSSTSTHGSQTYATPGTFSFTVPAGVTSINAIIIGPGGGGGAADGVYDNDGRGASGGSGGAYIGTIPVTPGQVLSVVVGAAGTAGTTSTYGPGTSGGDGGNSSVGSYVAYGGKGGSHAGGCSYGTYGAGAGGGGGGEAGYNGQAGVNGYTPQGSSGHYTNSGYGSLGGQAPGTGGNGGTYGSGSAGANGRVTILW